MKKIKKLPVVLSLAFCLVGVFGGCSLAVPEGEGGTPTPPNVKTEFEDCYVGQMLVICDKETDEVLTSQTLGDETCVAFAWRYDANVFDWEFDYKGIVYSDISGRDYIADLHESIGVFNDNSTDTADVTIYLNAVGHENRIYSFDTLSYDENGEIQTKYGAGHTGMFSHIGSNVEVKQTITKTVNDSTYERSMTLCVNMNVEVIDAGTDWKILEYDESGALIQADEITVDTEEEITLSENCAYFIQEETLPDGSKKRTLYEIDEVNGTYVKFFYDGGLGLMKKKGINVKKFATE